ncbi:hypothetical protein ACF0H5_020881 [Mactra antiquata]
MASRTKDDITTEPSEKSTTVLLANWQTGTCTKESTTTSVFYKQRLEKQYHENNVEIVLCFALTIFNIVTIILMVWMSGNFQYDPTLPVADICFPREYIEGHPDDRNTTYSNGTHYCLKNLNSTSEIIQNLTSRWLKEKFLKDKYKKYTRYNCYSDEKYSKESTSIKGYAAPSTKEHWNVLWDFNLTEENGNSGTFFQVHEDSGYIEIKVTSLYYVYSQVNIVYYEEETFEDPRQVSPVYYKYMHCIVKRKGINSSQTEKTILNNVDTRTPNETYPRHFSSYLGSYFDLLKGTVIAVRVYDKVNHTMPPLANFFGIHRIAN